mgnify:CR=1 FL=1
MFVLPVQETCVTTAGVTVLSTTIPVPFEIENVAVGEPILNKPPVIIPVLCATALATDIGTKSDVRARVPVVLGKVNVVEPATAAAFSIEDPEVEPARTSLPTAPPMVPKVLAHVTV